MQVWVDDTGRRVDGPRGDTVITVDAVMSGASVTLAGGLLLLTAFGLVRRLDRARHAAWDAEWAGIDARGKKDR